MSIPKFDHSRPASTVAFGQVRRLDQDGNLFTFAEFDRHEKKWKPEPTYIPPGTMGEDDLRTKLDELMFMNTKVITACKDLTGSVTNNLDKFIGQEQDKWAIERAKLEIQIEKLTIKTEELEAQLHEAQIMAARFEEEGKMLAAELKVFKDKIESFKDEPPQESGLTEAKRKYNRPAKT